MTRHQRDERGAVVIITALAMVALLLMAAIVIDLGATRAVRREARSVADSAATAGSLDLETGSAAACTTAFGYAFTNLGGSQPSAESMASACASAGMDAAATCTSGSTPARVATLTEAGRTVKVTHPVPDGDALLRATAVGGGATQTANATSDGPECARLGVEIVQTQVRIFGDVTSSERSTFSVHSVARYQPSDPTSRVLPALVALDETACKAIDAGNGDIWVENTAVGPGIVYSDSAGPAAGCSGSAGILHTGSSGSLRAAASGSEPGLLGWYSAATGGSTTGRSQVDIGTTETETDYVGQLVATASRTTRTPPDSVYHCTNIPATPEAPACTTADPVKDADDLAGLTAAPAGYATHAAPCDTTVGPITLSSDTYVSCPSFQVKGNPLNVRNGSTIIFAGSLAVAAGGTLAVNVSSPTAPAVAAGGLPVAAVPAGQSRLIVGSTAANAVDISSNSAALYLAQTFIYNRGGFNLQSLNKLLWSPPSSGPTKSLLYWSESAHPLAIQGGPSLTAAGVVFLANGTLTSGGSGELDLTNVQLWVDQIAITGSATMLLKPDPANSVSIPGPAPISSLIR